ncbi:MAG: FAD-dependent oxidoreductase [Gemmatimonadota bacterium]
MKRDLAALSGRKFQIVVVGGGIFGAAIARDAAHRGLSVALVEKGDFMSAASGNSYRMVHGGIRYLQHGDVARVRATSRERRILLTTAPHLVAPLPIAIPTYGRGMQGKSVLRAGLMAYDLLTFDRDRGIGDADRRLPPSRMMSRSELERMFPGVEREGLTGAGVFADAQLLHPQRLGIAALQSAVAEGAVVANYVEATGVDVRQGRVRTLAARDALTGDAFEIEADVVVVAAGAWSERLLASGAGIEEGEPSTFSRDLCLVVNRPAEETGLAVLGGTSDPDAVLSRSKRHLFVVPWRGRSIVGVWHIPYERSPDDIRVATAELQSFVDEFNRGYPGFQLRRDEITHYNTGLVLFGKNRPGAQDLRYGHRSAVTDHGREHGVDGLFTLIGVRYTTARVEAEALLDDVVKGRGWSSAPCATATTALFGGDIACLSDLKREYRGRWPAIDEAAIDRLSMHYGTNAPSVIDAEGDAPVSARDVLPRTIRHAIREEMAQTLEDVIVRRTDLGLFSAPQPSLLRSVAEVMAEAMGWDDARVEAEIGDVGAAYPLASEAGEPGRVPVDLGA